MLRYVWRKSPNFIRNFTSKILVKYLVLTSRQSRSKIKERPGRLIIMGNFSSGGGIGRSAERYCEQLEIKEKNPICGDTTAATCQPIRKHCPAVLALREMMDDSAPATVIIHLNPPHFLLALLHLGRNFVKNKYIIAYWAWELPALPPVWKYCLEIVDEIEVPSTFTQKIISQYTDKPVRVVHPIGHLSQKSPEDRQYGASGKLRCLFIFDLASSMERKNPEAAIKAFSLAFSPDEAELTIKILSPQASPVAMQQLQALEKEIPHLHILSEWLDETQLEALYSTHDVYLSLHRSEGFGSTLYEAMSKGLYVVATGWSGNMDFMRGSKVFPIPYTMEDIPQHVADHLGIRNCQWANPDINTAATILRNIYKECFPSGEKHCNIVEGHDQQVTLQQYRIDEGASK